MEVYDADNEDNLSDLTKQALLGAVEFQLHDVVTAIDQTFKKPIPNLINPKMKASKAMI